MGADRGPNRASVRLRRGEGGRVAFVLVDCLLLNDIITKGQQYAPTPLHAIALFKQHHTIFLQHHLVATCWPSDSTSVRCHHHHHLPQ
jgi:hypothetical protein